MVVHGQSVDESTAQERVSGGGHVNSTPFQIYLNRVPRLMHCSDQHIEKISSEISGFDRTIPISLTCSQLLK